jgi:WD40 repeat protein
MKGRTIPPQLVLWDTKTGKQRWSVTDSLTDVQSVVFSPDGRLVVSGHDFSGLALWEAGSGALLKKIEGYTATSDEIAFADGGLLASTSLEGPIHLWDISTGQEIRELAGHPDGTLAVAFEPDGKHLVSGGNDRLIRRWDVETGKETGELGKHAQPVCAVAIAPTGLIASGSYSRAIKLWDQHGKEKHLIENLKDIPWSLAISPDSSVLAASVGYKIQRWETETARPLPDLRGHRASVLAISYSRQGTLLASVAEDGSARLWNALSGSLDRELMGIRIRATCVAFSPDGMLVVAGSAGKYR